LQRPVTARAVQADRFPIAIGQSKTHQGLHQLVFAAIQLSRDFLKRGRNGGLVGVINAGFFSAVGGFAGGCAGVDWATAFALFVPGLNATPTANLSNQGCGFIRTDGGVAIVGRVWRDDFRQKKLQGWHGLLHVDKIITRNESRVTKNAFRYR
jgi:hypothetical protein